MQPLYKFCYPLDQRCYEEYNLSEDILMEHASMGMANYIKANFKEKSSVLIVCGVGNNGADGLVLARHLQNSYSVKVYLPFGVRSEMAELQLERVQTLEMEFVDEVEEADVIVDAIFGAGLSRELDEKTRKLIIKLEKLSGFKIACDVPTGIDGDGNPLPMALFCDVTITMGALKECLYTDMAKEHVGKVICVDLGLSHRKYTEGFQTDIFLLEEQDIMLPSRNRVNTHKGTFGHLGVILGAKEGAGIMSAMAALRFGAGLVSIVGEVKTVLPLEVMESVALAQNTTAIAFGMGFDEFDDEIVEDVLESDLPLILDAGVFSNEVILEFLEQKEREIVLTPHPKEFVSLWNISIDSPLNIAILQANRFEKVWEFCTLFPHVTLLLKGANIIIAQEQKLFVNPYGSAKLSKGGSGDVLAGLIAALLTQGYDGLEATIQASLAFTTAAKAYGGSSYAMLPTDLIEEISKLEKDSRII
ncbi:MAG: NAD(P)HX epimerase / NAD(P)HX dehydratase [uncultured Sulfurovum sp.]|uniref:Bifunctional NAD(P)H-hydrate repair enzyme n=1 Tax=uncultured Sulfurovum sp. TaxID=269237 RepID=A0A6S6SIN2_9BACT|nr:MAG: NAD(P)HX epimerase / NAD(P)HX dehydratase [uncultured Sulfurovum sp.]